MREALTRTAEVLRQPRYALLTLAVWAAVLLAVGVSVQWRNIGVVATSAPFDLRTRMRLIVSLIAGPQTTLDEGAIAAVTLLAGLFAVNVALNAFAARGGGGTGRVASGLWGFAVGTLGIGCAACGSFAFGGFLTVAATSAVVTALPLGGKEFLLAGIGVMLVATYRTMASLGRKTCPV